jgi:hypothetical protein
MPVVVLGSSQTSAAHQAIALLAVLGYGSSPGAKTLKILLNPLAQMPARLPASDYGDAALILGATANPVVDTGRLFADLFAQHKSLD